MEKHETFWLNLGLCGIITLNGFGNRQSNEAFLKLGNGRKRFLNERRRLNKDAECWCVSGQTRGGAEDASASLPVKF